MIDAIDQTKTIDKLDSTDQDPAPDTSNNCGVATPCPTLALTVPPPSNRFFPPLSLLRRNEVHERLLEIAKNYPVRSLLDVGCGTDTTLLSSLQACDDNLPLQILTGLDLDDDLWTIGVANCFPGATARESHRMPDSERWRELHTSLIHGIFWLKPSTLQRLAKVDFQKGSFLGLSESMIGQYDAITSSEVIEHLKPELLSSFAPVLLGKMQPKVLIVTTPNRDFNPIFEMCYDSKQTNVNLGGPYVYDPKMDEEQRRRSHYYAPYEYRMRHHDHKFEWTRKEFENWANAASQKFGYDVSFTGCATLYDGFTIEGPQWDIEGALRAEIIRRGGQDMLQVGTLKEAFLQTFGHCSQVATFVRIEKQEAFSSLKSSRVCDNNARLGPLPPSPFEIRHRLKPFKLDFVFDRLMMPSPDAILYQRFPPSFFQLLGLHENAINICLPADIADDWMSTGYAPRTPEDCRKVVVYTTTKTIWDFSWEIRRTCRFNYNVYLKCLRSADLEISVGRVPNVESTWISIPDHSDGGKEETLLFYTKPKNVPIELARPCGIKSWTTLTATYNSGDNEIEEDPTPPISPPQLVPTEMVEEHVQLDSVAQPNFKAGDGGSLATSDEITEAQTLATAEGNAKLPDAAVTVLNTWDDSDAEDDFGNNKTMILFEEPTPTIVSRITWPLNSNSQNQMQKSAKEVVFKTEMKEMLKRCDAINNAYFDRIDVVLAKPCSVSRARRDRKKSRFIRLNGGEPSDSEDEELNEEVKAEVLGANVFKYSGSGDMIDYDLKMDDHDDADHIPLVVTFIRPKPICRPFKDIGRYEKEDIGNKWTEVIVSSVTDRNDEW